MASLLVFSHDWLHCLLSTQKRHREPPCNRNVAVQIRASAGQALSEFPSASQLASASLLTRYARCGSIAELNNLFLRLSCSSEVTAERAAQVMAELAEEAAQAALPAPPKPTPEPAGASDSAAQAGGGSNKKKNKKKR